MSSIYETCYKTITIDSDNLELLINQGYIFVSVIIPIIENEKRLLSEFINSNEAKIDETLKEYCIGKLSGIKLMESLYKMELSR